MLKQIVSIFALVAIATSQNSRNDDPCAGVTAGQWAQDWATCQNLFWCGPAGARVAAPCSEGFGFDDVAMECNAAAATCDPCPTDPEVHAVAATIDTCSDYTFCHLGSRNADVLSCPDGTVFNRVTGQCALSGDCVPGGAPPSGPGPECPATGVESVEVPGNCQQWRDCVDGTKNARVNDCGAGMHFNPGARNCDLPERRVPLCPAAASNVEYIPQPPHNTHPLPSFRERLMKKLHIH